MPADTANAKVADFYEQVYERGGLGDNFSDPLVRLNKNFEIEPAAALESGHRSEDGKTWTFQLAEEPRVERRKSGHRGRLGQDLPIRR